MAGETDAAAQARVKHFNEGADLEAMTTRAWEFSQSAKEWSRDEALRREQLKNSLDGRTPSAITRNAIVGSPATLVRGIAELIEQAQFDWLGFYFAD